MVNAPSRTFIKRAFVILLTVVLFIVVQKNWATFFSHKKESGLKAIGDLTIQEALQKDSNNNGITDWEERIWGLDPTIAVTDGVSNKIIVENKRKEAKGEQETDTTITKTDEYSRALFALSATLEQNSADLDTIKTTAEKLGDDVTISKFRNKYQNDQLKKVKTTEQSLQTYATTFSTIYKKYPLIGSELPIIVDLAETGTLTDTTHLTTVGLSYQKLAADLMKISVPVGAAEYHLGIANSLYNIGVAIDYLTISEEDGIKAVAGASFYGGYSTLLTEHANALEKYLAQYSIIAAI